MKFATGGCVAVAAAALVWASGADATTCTDSYTAMKAEVRHIIDDAQDVNEAGSGPLGYVWVAAGEALELSAKLHNADEDVTWKRRACASLSYTQNYDPVPSYNPNPPSGATMAQVQAVLESARASIELELGDLDAAYLPCTTCMTNTEHNIVLTPMASFASTLAIKRNQVWPTTRP